MFITFEGIEGCGKSTQARRLARRLEGHLPVLFTIEPGGTRIGGLIRRILLDAANHDLDPLAELFLYQADRAQHVAEVIGPGLASGRWVVCDRFFDATTVYQGYARGQDLFLIQQLNTLASGGLTPDLTFLLDCPAELGLQRAHQRDAAGRDPLAAGQDRFEKESIAFHQAVREGYLALTRSEQIPGRFVTLDASLPMDRLEQAVWSHLQPHLPATGRQPS